MFSYERSVNYPEGHRNVIFAQRGIRPLPRLPITKENETVHAPDTADAVRVSEALQRHRGVAHQRHQHGHRLARQRSGGRAGGRDLPGRPAELRDAGRAALEREKDSIGGWRPKGFVNLALQRATGWVSRPAPIISRRT